MFSAFNPSKCTHTCSSGQPTLRRPVGGSVPCSRVSPQSWTIPARAEIQTHNLRLQVRHYPLGHDCPNNPVNTLLSKSLGSIRFFNVFERSLFCSIKLVLFDQKYSNIVKYYYNLNKGFLFEYNVLLWWESWIFSIITPVLVSHDPSEIILI